MNGFNQIKLLRHHLNAHNIINLMLSGIFVFLRICSPFCKILFPSHNEDFPVCKLSWDESNILFFVICVLVVKNRKGPTLQKYLANLFLFSKAANLFLFFRVDPRLMLLYSIACLLTVVLFPEPAYSGPINVTYFTDSTIEEELEENPNITWLIEFYANWSSECQALAGPFAELSLQYSHANFKFGKLDAGRYSEIARKYKVDISPLKKQLPTIILFQKGKEVMRKPGINSKGAIVKYIFTKESVEKDFDLKNLYENTKSKAMKKADKKQQKEEDETKKGR